MRSLAARSCILALAAAAIFAAAASCSKEQQAPSSAGGVTAADLSFPGLQMRPGADRTTFTLVGRVRNRSDRTVTEVKLNVWMEDVLYSGASTRRTSTVVVLRQEVPPSGSRSFEESVVFNGLPEPRGRHEWNYSIAGVKGK